MQPDGAVRRWMGKALVPCFHREAMAGVRLTGTCAKIEAPQHFYILTSGPLATTGNPRMKGMTPPGRHLNRFSIFFLTSRSSLCSSNHLLAASFIAAQKLLTSN